MTEKLKVSCDGKDPLQFGEARKIARRIMRSKRSTGRRVEAYRCVHCGAWHVGGTFIRSAK